MMSLKDIEMCVVDAIRDDDIENVETILCEVNGDEDSWEAARGYPFTAVEVRDALVRLIADSLVTPCAEQPPLDGFRPIPARDVGTTYPWDGLWFHLENSGRLPFKQWWESEGCSRYPLQD
jgi:hypothetical protein